MKNKRLASILCFTLTASLLISGCSSTDSASSAASTASEDTSTETTDEEASNITAQITSINESEVTATVGTLTTAQSAGEEAAPNAPADDSSAPSDGASAPSGEAPDKPEGDSGNADAPSDGSSAPSGEAPDKPEGDSGNADAPSDGSSAPSGEAPDKPEGNSGNADAPSDGSSAPSGEAPDKPEGNSGNADAPSDGSSAPSGEAPDKPEGDNGNGEAPNGQMPGGSTFEAGSESITFTITDSTVITIEFQQGSQEGTLEDLAENQVIEVELDGSNQAISLTVKNLQAGGGFGGSSEVTNGTSAASLDDNASVSDATYLSEGDDENALRADGVTASLSGVTIEKTAGESSNTEDGDFYGQNAAFLALNGADVTITDATVNTSVTNGNGIFSYGEGTTVTISDSTIHTTGRNSGGIQTTGGGTTIANNLTITTEGDSAAAIRSDRGGGTVTVDGGTYTTSGLGSPAVYSTADITVKNATLTANNSEGLVIEGKNSIALENCTVSGNMTSSASGSDNDNLHAVMIYQSMSGDAALGQSSFSSVGGSITSLSGDLFYVTNTSCTISLTNTKLVTANGQLFTISGNDSSRGWGTSGSNGGDVTLTVSQQTMEGNITVDDISSLDMTLSDSSAFTGTINTSGTAGEVNVTLDSTSTWTLTGDSYVTSFTGDLSQVVSTGYQLYVNGSAVLE